MIGFACRFLGVDNLAAAYGCTWVFSGYVAWRAGPPVHGGGSGFPVWFPDGKRSARRREHVERVAREHPGVHGIVGDVSAKDDIYPIAMQVIGELGGLDVLINNASDLGPAPLTLLGDTPCEDLERALATNVLGPFRLTKALLGALTASAREGRGAVVLNISSDAAVNAYPRWGAYGASKAALHHLTRIWNEELAAQGVHFLSLDPGDMDTPMHALAVPEADPATLKRPEVAAHELADAIRGSLPVRTAV